MKKVMTEKDNEILSYMALVMLLLGLCIGTCFIAVGINCSSINEIAFCIFGVLIMLIFSITALVMYLSAKKDELRKLFNDNKVEDK